MNNDLISRSALLEKIKTLAQEIARENGGVDHVTYALKVAFDFAKEAPAVDAEPVRHEGCEFCRKFDFSEARCEVNSGYAHISIACANTRFSKSEQFNYCPNCGAKMDAEVDDDENNNHDN